MLRQYSRICQVAASTRARLNSLLFANVPRSRRSVNRRWFGTEVLELSEIHGDRSQPMLNKPIGAFFEEKVQSFGDKELLRVVHQDIRWSWKDMNKKVDEFSLGLLRLGLKKGDRLGIWMPNCIEWAVAQLATAKLGIISVSINPAYRQHELTHALRLVGCQALLYSDFGDANHTEMLLELIPELRQVNEDHGLESFRFPSLKHVIHTGNQKVPGMSRYEDNLVQRAAGYNEYTILKSMESRIAPDDAINIQFTSGTSGAPKGATLSHIDLLNNAFFVGKRLHLGREDRVCMPIPLYHGFGLVVGYMSAITHGASLVFPAPAFEPQATLEAIGQEKCTVVHGVPTMFQSLLQHPDLEKHNVACLKTAVLMGGKCTKKLAQGIKEKLTVPNISVCYGMIETAPISFQTLPGDSLENITTTVGKPLDYTDGCVVGIDEKVLPCNQPGELLVRGYNIMKGYWNDDTCSKAAVDKDGWMHTGDVAVIREDGYCSIVGRVKDTIVRGGQSVHAQPIEEFLNTHPGIEEVYVVGVPDKEYGENICAWVKMRKGHKATQESIIDFCKNQIAHFNIPKYVLFADTFPKSSLGLVQKYKLREESIKKLGLEVDEA